MIIDGPDGHCDGSGVIADFVEALPNSPVDLGDTTDKISLKDIGKLHGVKTFGSRNKRSIKNKI